MSQIWYKLKLMQVQINGKNLNVQSTNTSYSWKKNIFKFFSFEFKFYGSFSWFFLCLYGWGFNVKLVFGVYWCDSWMWECLNISVLRNSNGSHTQDLKAQEGLQKAISHLIKCFRVDCTTHHKRWHFKMIR